MDLKERLNSLLKEIDSNIETVIERQKIIEDMQKDIESLYFDSIKAEQLLKLANENSKPFTDREKQLIRILKKNGNNQHIFVVLHKTDLESVKSWILAMQEEIRREEAHKEGS